MAFDDKAVRIELHAAMRFGHRDTGDGKTALDLVPGEVAHVWLLDENGRATTRKPAMKFGGADQSRADILRDLAAWMDARDDPGLVAMVEEMKKIEG